MFLPHKILNSRSFVPVTNSGEAARLFADKETDELADIKRYLDRSDRIFLEASVLIEKYVIKNKLPVKVEAYPFLPD